MKGKRVLQMIGDLNPGGAETVVASLSRELSRFRWDVSLRSRDGGSLLSLLEGIPVSIVGKKNGVDLSYLWSLIHDVKENQIDIIHSHLFGNNLYAAATAVLSGRKTILTVHGEDCLRPESRMRFYRVASRFVSRIVAVSSPLHEKLRADLALGPEKVTLIPNGIDLERFRRPVDVLRKKSDLGLPGNVPVIGAVGNIKPVKGYDVLIEAAVSVFRRIPGARFVIVGESYQAAHRESLERLLAERGIGDRFHFLGKRTDVAEILPVMDVYVLPSRSEGTSISLLEAMAARRAIVATDVGGTPHIIRDGQQGILIPPGNPEALAGAILRMLDRAELREELGKRAGELAETEYGVGAMTKKYVELYEEILAA